MGKDFILVQNHEKKNLHVKSASIINLNLFTSKLVHDLSSFGSWLRTINFIKDVKHNSFSICLLSDPMIEATLSSASSKTSVSQLEYFLIASFLSSAIEKSPFWQRLVNTLTKPFKANLVISGFSKALIKSGICLALLLDAKIDSVKTFTSSLLDISNSLVHFLIFFSFWKCCFSTCFDFLKKHYRIWKYKVVRKFLCQLDKKARPIISIQHKSLI